MNASVLLAALLSAAPGANVTDSEDGHRTLVGIAVVLACIFATIWVGTLIDKRARG
jgi:hypothetical protein